MMNKDEIQLEEARNDHAQRCGLVMNKDEIQRQPDYTIYPNGCGLVMNKDEIQLRHNLHVSILVVVW